MTNQIVAVRAQGPWSRDKYGVVVDANGDAVHFRSASISCSGPRVAEAEKNTDLAAIAPCLLYALQRLIAVDDARATLHAPDGDDISRMIEHAEAHKFAREVLAKAVNP